MRPTPLVTAVALVCTVNGAIEGLSAQPPGAEAPDVETPGPLGRNAAPLSLSEAALGAMFLLSLIGPEPLEKFDEEVSVALARDAGNRNTWPRWAGRELGGGKLSLAAAVGPLAFGLGTSDSDATSLGLHSLESLYASALVTRLIKILAGRARPETSPEPDLFLPFNPDAAYHSFPSGHTARVFALATVYSRHLAEDTPWVPWVVYSLAAWTATTRVMDGSHWLTDVTAGAVVGIVTARLVERLVHRAQERSRFSLAFFPLPDERLGLGVRVRLR